MDPQAERRFTSLKKRLDALHYCQPLTIESAALAERLLNDLLKTTEGFQKLKKMNDELKQKQNDNQDGTILQQQLERVTIDNNQLHQNLIKAKDDWQTEVSSLKLTIKQLESKAKDAEYRANQTQHQNNIASRTGISENADPNASGSDPNNSLNNFQNQQNVWAEELRRADERASRFHAELAQLQQQNAEVVEQNRLLNSKLESRDAEITRLQVMTPSSGQMDSLRAQHEEQRVEQRIQAVQKQCDHLIEQNQAYSREITDLESQLGVYKSSQKGDRLELATAVRKLKQRNEHLQTENDEMTRMIQAYRDGNYNVSEGAKLLADEKHSQIQGTITDLEREADRLRRENAALKMESERTQQMTSAVQSNSRAFSEKMNQIQAEAQDKDHQISQLNVRLKDTEQDLLRTQHELGEVKGKASALQRDAEMNYSQITKTSQAHALNQEHVQHLNARIKQLETDYEQMREQRNESQSEATRMNQQVSILEKELVQQKSVSMKAQGDSSSSSATVQRLMAQLNGKQNDIDLLKQQRQQLQDDAQKAKLSEADQEKRYNDLYRSMIQTKESLDMLTNEQQLLSQELTDKQNECLKIQRQMTEQERELVVLRPMKEQFNQLSAGQQKQIEDATRGQFENNKLKTKIKDLESQLRLVQNDKEDLQDNYKKLAADKQSLVVQLTQFEKESFEIQAKVQKTIELGRQSEQNEQSQIDLNQQIHELTRQLEQMELQTELKKSEFSRLESKLSQSQAYSEQLEKDLKESRNEVNQMQNQLNQGADTTVKQAGITNRKEVQIVELSSDLDHCRTALKSTQNELSDTKKNLQAEILKTGSLSAQVDRMKVLCQNLDQTKEELLQKLQSTIGEKRGTDSEKAVLQQDVSAYQRELALRDQTISDLKLSISQLDSNADELQSLLDDKTEELQRCKMQLERQSLEFGNVQHQMSVVAGKEDNMQKRLFERESEIKYLKNELHELKQTVEQQTTLAQLKTQEVAELTEDIQTLTRENRYVNTEFGKQAHANDILKKQNQEASDRERRTLQASRALELEKEDILQNYREANTQIDQLQLTIENLGKENQELFLKINEGQKDQSGLSYQLEQFQQKEEQFIAEIMTLERHIDHITRQLEDTGKEKAEVCRQNEELIQQLNTFQGVAMGQEQNRTELQRTLSRLENDRANQSVQINELKVKVQAKETQMVGEKGRLQELESLISEERREKHLISVDKECTERKNQELQTEVERLRLRVESLQKHIDTMKSQSAMGGSVSQYQSISGVQPSGLGASTSALRNASIHNGQSQSNIQMTGHDEVSVMSNANPNDLSSMQQENQQLKEQVLEYQNQLNEVENNLKQMSSYS